TPIVEPRLEVRIPARVLDPTAQIEGHSRHLEARAPGFALRAQPLDLRGKLRRDAFVGIQTEDPIVRGLLGGEVFLRGVAGPRSYKHVVGESPRDLYRAVVAFGIDDYDFVGPTNGAKGGGNVVLFVVSDDSRGDLHSIVCHISLARSFLSASTAA